MMGKLVPLPTMISLELSYGEWRDRLARSSVTWCMDPKPRSHSEVVGAKEDVAVLTCERSRHSWFWFLDGTTFVHGTSTMVIFCSNVNRIKFCKSFCLTTLGQLMGPFFNFLIVNLSSNLLSQNSTQLIFGCNYIISLSIFGMAIPRRQLCPCQSSAQGGLLHNLFDSF